MLFGFVSTAPGATNVVHSCPEILWASCTISTCHERSLGWRGSLWEGSHWELCRHFWMQGCDTILICMVHRSSPGEESVMRSETNVECCSTQGLHACILVSCLPRLPVLPSIFDACSAAWELFLNFVARHVYPTYFAAVGQVKANNMSILSPRAAMVAPATSAEWERWQTDMLSEPQHMLTNLCEALSAWLQPQPSRASILLAMLLSAVTAGTFPQPTSDIERSQVKYRIPTVLRPSDPAGRCRSQ